MKTQFARVVCLGSLAFYPVLFYCLVILDCYICFPVNSFRSLENNTQGQSDKVVSLAKWRILNRLHDRNETLYYRVS